jgi:hypothetical protein
MVSPCVLTPICYSLLHGDKLRACVIRDADVGCILRKVIERRRGVRCEPGNLERLDLGMPDMTSSSFGWQLD